jgi:hypothetical protein
MARSRSGNMPRFRPGFRPAYFIANQNSVELSVLRHGVLANPSRAAVFGAYLHNDAAGKCLPDYPRPLDSPTNRSVESPLRVSISSSPPGNSHTKVHPMRSHQPRIAPNRNGVPHDTTNGRFVSKKNDEFYKAGVADGRRQERARLMLELEQRQVMGLSTTSLPRLRRATRLPLGPATTAELSQESRQDSANQTSHRTSLPQQTSRMGAVLKILGFKRPA